MEKNRDRTSVTTDALPGANAPVRPLADLDRLTRELDQFEERWRPVSAGLVEWARAVYGSWNAQDVDAIVALCTEDIVLESPALFGDVVRGQEDLLRFADAFFAAFPDFHIEPVEAPYLAADGRKVAQLWRATGTFQGPMRMFPLRSRGPLLAPTGRRFEVAGVNLYEFRDGLLARQQFHHDVAEWMQQVRLLPPWASLTTRILAAGQRLGAPVFRRGVR